MSEPLQWIESQQHRRAILVIDMVESVRLLQTQELDVIDRWRRFVHEMLRDVLPKHQGRMVKSLGDGMLMDFACARDAVETALESHQCIERYSAGLPPSSAIYLRAGVHVAPVVTDGNDIFGSGVNLASRLASLASPRQTVASDAIRDEMVAGFDVTFHDLGSRYVKHVELPVRAFRVEPVDNSRNSALADIQLPKAQLLRPSLAVLTFGEGDESNLLGRLLSDEFARIASVNGRVDVQSRLSTRRLHGMAAGGERALKFLEHLNAVYGVAGDCLERAGNVYLTLELLHVPTNTILWTDRTQFKVKDAIAHPGDVIAPLCNRALAQLEVHEVMRAKTISISSLEAYSLLLGGVTMMHRLAKPEFLRARELLQAVVDRSPRHPDAYAWLSKWHILSAYQGWASDMPEAQARAADYAERALELDSRCSLALTTAGMVATYFKRRIDEGQSFYNDAIASNPSEPMAWLLKGMSHAFQGEGEAALTFIARAQSLSPVDPMRYYFDSLAAAASASAGHYEDAVTLAQRSLQENRLHASTWRTMVIAASILGRHELAASAVASLMELEPTFTVKEFLARTPAADFPIAKRFAEALAKAGVPKG